MAAGLWVAKLSGFAIPSNPNAVTPFIILLMKPLKFSYRPLFLVIDKYNV